jgi:hypothetical protein
MPTNIIKINNAFEYEVPDSWMEVLLAYLDLVEEKTAEEK